jgi:hypothetical protein
MDDLNDAHDQEAIRDADTFSNSLVSALTGRHPERDSLSPFTMQTASNEHKDVNENLLDVETITLDTVGRALTHRALPLGVDKLEFSLRVGRLRTRESGIWELITQQGTGDFRYSMKMPVGEGKAHIHMVRNQIIGKLYVSFNPSTVLYGPYSGRIASLDEAIEICGWIINELDYLVEIAEPLSKAKLRRVDVSVDIPNISDMQGLLEAAAMSSYNPQVKANTYRGVRGLESVACRSKTGGGFIVYNKSLQMGTKGATARFEAQSRTRHLKEVCPTLGDLTPQLCRHIFNRYFANLAVLLCARPTTPPDAILGDKKHLKTFVTSVGLSVLSDLGYKVPVTDYWRLQKYRPFKKRYPHRVVGDLFGTIVGQ